ncbi:MAG: FlgD immunoglobulin-like domain containing protein [Candidatus Marinimicrobia bacterium]|nr:FlgD immunoglobulin-like domain containing protein [Candidatus Neomarinimicrobiota bacterium]
MLNDDLIAGAGSSSEKHEYSYIDQDVKNGVTYWYKLEDIGCDEKTKLYGPISAMPVKKDGPSEFCLYPNYPNPFNPVTTISYDLPEDVYVELPVYNVRGEKVTTLFKGNQRAGLYKLDWDGTDKTGKIVSSGIYFINITSDSYCKTNKMVFIR